MRTEACLWLYLQFGQMEALIMVEMQLKPFCVGVCEWHT